MIEQKRKTERVWISAAQAGLIIGVNPRSVPDLAGRGLVGVRIIPGKAAKYNRDDCAKLAEDATRPATATLATAAN